MAPQGLRRPAALYSVAAGATLTWHRFMSAFIVAGQRPRYQTCIGKNAILAQHFVGEEKCYNFIDNIKRLLSGAPFREQATVFAPTLAPQTMQLSLLARAAAR
ncbi:MAG TPA: hypothetical protein VFT05_05030 [Burkholderiaceae bacterium]|nr:hypothetical protein [Burkholderiaceae bacterium]